MGIKKFIPIILNFVVIILILSGCNIESPVIREYLTYHEDRQVYVIDDDAFENAKKINSERIDPDVDEILYIAKYGFKELKFFEVTTLNKNKSNERIVIKFVDIEDQGYIIFESIGRVVIKPVPRIAIDDEYQIRFFNQITDANAQDLMDIVLYRPLNMVYGKVEKTFMVFGKEMFTYTRHEIERESDEVVTVTLYSEEGLKIIFNKQSTTEKTYLSYRIREYNDNTAVETSVSLEGYRHVVEPFIRENNLILVDFKVGFVDDDREVDYVVLAKEDIDDSEGYIFVIDGKSQEVIADTKVKIGYDTALLGLRDITGNGRGEIEYLTYDGEIIRQIFMYKNGILEEIFYKLKGIPEIRYDMYSNALYVYYDSLDLTHWINLNNRAAEGYFDLIARGMDTRSLTYINSTTMNIEKPGEITIVSYLICTPLGVHELAEISQTFRFNNDNWKLINVEIEIYDNYKGVNLEIIQGPGEEKAKGWYSEGILTINESNIDEIFNLTKDSVKSIHGSPIYTEGSGDANLIFDVVTYTYLGGNKIWAPSGITVTGKDSSVFGVNIGMTNDEVRKILGNPETENSNKMSGEGNILIYNIKGYEVIVEIIKDRVKTIMIKSKQ